MPRIIHRLASHTSRWFEDVARPDKKSTRDTGGNNRGDPPEATRPQLDARRTIASSRGARMSRMMSVPRAASSERARAHQTRLSLPVVVACLVVSSFYPRVIPGVHAQGAGAPPGEQCSDHSDCVSWNGGGGWFRPCLGGHCCSFELNQYEYYDQWSANRYGNCTSCGGVSQVYPHMNGRCDACASGTRLITEQDNNGNNMYANGYEPGTCVPICGEGEYFDYNMFNCQPKRQPGEWCQWHVFDSDDQCSSGMCGFEHCCSEEAVNSGCDRPCDESGVCGGDSYPGESCVDHSDCYGNRPCLGGKCCQFDMYSYNSSAYYDPMMYGMYGSSLYEGCTACGGVVWQGDESSNSVPNMYPPGYYGPGYGPGGGEWDHLFHPDNGRCSACAETHTLVTQEDIEEQMRTGNYHGYLQPGTCRKICGEGEYFDYNMFNCQPKRQPGEWCDRHRFDSDDQCSSGMCGYQYCCSQEAAEAGCQNPCDYWTGACSSKSAPGGECSQDSDCYVGLHENSRKCLGGHCCSFDAWQYVNNDPWMGNRYSDCTSCGGVFVPPEFDPNDPYAYMGYRVQDGQCDACEPGKRLIKIEDNFINGMHVGGYEVGTCAPVCAEDEYLTHQYTCETKTLPGGACWGESRMCTSGLCGSPHCCSDAAAEVQDDDTDNPQCCMQCDANGNCVHRGDCSMLGYNMYAGAGTFPGDYSGVVTLPDSLPIAYPGTSGCQLTCEGHGHDEAKCGGIRGCVYKVEDGLCWSAVGSEPCPPSMKEVEEQAKKRAEEKRAAANEKRREADELELVLQEKERELEAAEEALDAAGETLVASVSDPRLREKLGVLSDCAKSENDVPIMNIPSITAASGDAACDEAWQSANCARCEANGFCEWSSTTGRRRRLLVSGYNVSLGFNPDRVDESDLTEAMNALSVSGFTASRTTVDPVSALQDTDGVSASAVESFAASVTAARTARNEVASAESAFDAADRAASEAEAAADDAEDTANKIAERNRPTTSPQTPPPPPSPPPKALVWDDESTAEPVRRSLVLLVAIAAIPALARR